VVIPGPKALGLVIAAYMIVTVRTIINRNTLAMIVFSILAMALSQIVVVAIMTFRSLYTAPAPNWHASHELAQRMLSSLYTGASGAVLALLLFACVGLFRFHEPHTRRSGLRGEVRMRR
jgi:ABC-type transport system involved in Fe-S cluster assembly fused permease/ATPase subunit